MFSPLKGKIFPLFTQKGFSHTQENVPLSNEKYIVFQLENLTDSNREMFPPPTGKIVPLLIGHLSTMIIAGRENIQLFELLLVKFQNGMKICET